MTNTWPTPCAPGSQRLARNDPWNFQDPEGSAGVGRPGHRCHGLRITGAAQQMISGESASWSLGSWYVMVFLSGATSLNACLYSSMQDARFVMRCTLRENPEPNRWSWGPAISEVLAGGSGPRWGTWRGKQSLRHPRQRMEVSDSQ